MSPSAGLPERCFRGQTISRENIVPVISAAASGAPEFPRRPHECECGCESLFVSVCDEPACDAESTRLLTRYELRLAGDPETH